MNQLKGKRLLILGANPETVPLIEKANSMGIYTIVTDYNHDAYAKKFASKSYDIDGKDVDSLVELCLKEKVDGVLVGVADRLIVPYQKVCEKLNLPCYGNSNQCNILTDKILFDLYCKKYGVAGIPSYDINIGDFNDNEYIGKEDIKFPLLVKPADSNSSKGLSICRNYQELKEGILAAEKISTTNRVLVERFMDCDDIFINYTFINGECIVTEIADRYKKSEKNETLCIGAFAPSKYSKIYFEKEHKKMISMFKELNMKTSTLMLSAFVENNNFYFYDPGFRLQGEAPNITIEKMVGFDQLEMLIKYAIMGSYKLNVDRKIQMADWNGYSATVWISLNRGEIGSINGLDAIKKNKNIYKIIQRLYEGDVVKSDMIGTEAQVCMRIYLSCMSKQNVQETIDKIYDTLQILDTQNNNMINLGVMNIC